MIMVWRMGGLYCCEQFHVNNLNDQSDGHVQTLSALHQAHTISASHSSSESFIVQVVDNDLCVEVMSCFYWYFWRRP